MYTKSTLLLAILFCFSCLAQPATSETIDGKPVIPAEKDTSGVVLRLYENRSLPSGQGVSIYIDGWYPNDKIQLLLIGPQEEKRYLISDNARLPVSDTGHLEFSFPYDHEALYPGEWTLLVIGKSGAHGHKFHVPKRQ